MLAANALMLSHEKSRREALTTFDRLLAERESKKQPAFPENQLAASRDSSASKSSLSSGILMEPIPCFGKTAWHRGADGLQIREVPAASYVRIASGSSVTKNPSHAFVRKYGRKRTAIARRAEQEGQPCNRWHRTIHYQIGPEGFTREFVNPCRGISEWESSKPRLDHVRFTQESAYP